MQPIEPALIVHGGAGRIAPELAKPQRRGCLAAARAGWHILASGGRALDAVEAAVRSLEDDPAFNAGLGSVLNAAGNVELDASIMDGEGLRAGGVGAVAGIANPISLARRVLEDGRHVLLVGPGAVDFARAQRLPTCAPEALITEHQRARFDAAMGTVGCVARDRHGHCAAATSTGGRRGKLPGRVGDSAVIGAGTYASRHGAVSCTGVGEAILTTTLARTATELMAEGLSAQEAVERALTRFASLTGSEAGLIAVDAQGRLGHAHNAQAMTVALVDARGQPWVEALKAMASRRIPRPASRPSPP